MREKKKGFELFVLAEGTLNREASSEFIYKLRKRIKWNVFSVSDSSFRGLSLHFILFIYFILS